MPKSIMIPNDASRAGILITWTRSARRIDVSGWYDSYVGIRPESFTLEEFLTRLGITKADVDKALRDR